MEHLDHRIAGLSPHARLFLPAGPGPHPIVVQMHGCGGCQPFQLTWAKVATSAGWAALVVDSYPHRGISRFEALATVCTGLRLPGRERAGDLFAALAWLRRQDWADSRRIVAAGWSHGGWTVLDALALNPGAEARAATRLEGLPDEPLDGVVGAFVVYPYVGLGSLARRGLRYDAKPLAIVGGRDVIVNGPGSERTLRRMSTPSGPIDVRRFDRATHAFDEPQARDTRVRYDAELTAEAQDLLRRYLAAAVGQRRAA